LVQHFRSVPEYLAAFTAYAIAYLPHLTPGDIPNGLTLGSTFRPSAAALASLPVNLWRSSDWDEFKPHATFASDPATATALSLTHQQLPAEILRVVRTLDTSFLNTVPASGSPADAKPPADSDSDADGPGPDDLAQPKAEEAPAGPGTSPRLPLPDPDLLAALRSDTLLVDDLRRHLEDRGLPTVGLKGVLVGRLFEHLLAPPSPAPLVRSPSGGPASARSIVDSLTLLDQASALTNRLAATASSYPRLLSELYPDATASPGSPTPDARFLHGLVVRELDAYLNKQRSLLFALQVSARVQPGERSALAHALSSTGLETAALSLFTSQPPTRSEHPLLIVTRCLPLADLAFALLRKFFVPGSNPGSARLLEIIGTLDFVTDGEVKLADPSATFRQGSVIAVNRVSPWTGIAPTASWSVPSPKPEICDLSSPPMVGPSPGPPSPVTTRGVSWRVTSHPLSPPRPSTSSWHSSPSSHASRASPILP